MIIQHINLVFLFTYAQISYICPFLLFVFHLLVDSDRNHFYEFSLVFPLESVWYYLSEIHYLYWRWGTSGSPSHPVSSTSWNKEAAESSPEIIHSVQQCHRNCEQLSRDPLVRSEYWKNQHWTFRVPEQVRNSMLCMSRNFWTFKMCFFFLYFKRL